MCDADDVARAVTARDGEAYAGVVAAFGVGFVQTDGELDRAALGRRVFGSPAELARLNALVHPAVMNRLRAWAVEAAARAPHLAAVIPLLYEIEDAAAWDLVICIGAPEAEQLARLHLRGLSEAEARARIAAQWPLATKMERADRVIFNGGTPAELKQQTQRVIRSIRGE